MAALVNVLWMALGGLVLILVVASVAGVGATSRARDSRRVRAYVDATGTRCRRSELVAARARSLPDSLD